MRVARGGYPTKPITIGTRSFGGLGHPQLADMKAIKKENERLS